ncbi:MAG: hypothetical protein JWQ40_4122 [Segetibacter sp.]|nr:hypothetical protein [Segetibacter sp.]
MKPLFFLLILAVFSFPATAQPGTGSTSNDTLAPYQKSPYIPSFTIQQPDSSWFSKQNLDTKKPTLILYFSPDCGHCQLETEAILTKMKDLSNLQIVMITSRPYQDMLNFANNYKITRFHGIKIGSDPARLITRFYDVKFTPFSALYDKKGKLVKVYKDGINMEELIALQK